MQHRSLVLLLLLMAPPVSAQIRSGDSVAVVRTIERFHAMLGADDTAGVRGLMGPSAAILEAGKIHRMKEDQTEYLAFRGRWARAINRKPSPIEVHLLGVTAWAYSVSEFNAVGAPIQGLISELVVLTRLGNSWFIEAVMWANASPDS